MVRVLYSGLSDLGSVQHHCVVFCLLDKTLKVPLSTQQYKG